MPKRIIRKPKQYRVVFLDVDGVLNWSETKDRVNGFIGLCPERIARLNRITDAYKDSAIVISSTWRRTNFHGHPKGCKGILKSRGVTGKFIGETPYRFSYHSRGGEIRDWLEANVDKVKSYVILDDSTDGMEGSMVAPYGEVPFEIKDLRANHVISHWSGDPNVEGEQGGLLDKHVEAAIKVLGGENFERDPLIFEIPKQGICRECGLYYRLMPQYHGDGFCSDTCMISYDVGLSGDSLSDEE